LPLAGLVGLEGRLAELAGGQESDCGKLVEEALKLEKKACTKLRALGRAPDDAWAERRE